jgi:hypothetical protein
MYLLSLLTYLLTELSPSWGAVNCAASQGLPSILWNPKVQYHVHKSPALVDNLFIYVLCVAQDQVTSNDWRLLMNEVWKRCGRQLPCLLRPEVQRKATKTHSQDNWSPCPDLNPDASELNATHTIATVIYGMKARGSVGQMNQEMVSYLSRIGAAPHV